ncbi:MarR family winged helix-turn-helix transcriptional regulator [Perlabentimonas gracilis]|uniref:MarR family winged helix-turn-helix transcriptional regulator n=1 Tax=Perlabentimonas gracilis TaxID=2715279 RepID=UPI001407D881|nr:MarR family transcriptional regulator [Perlabentimonas gracilis]NHB68856.1 MarR family transcriptional regulator [Perlabentimonas gracilis]
MAHDQLKLSNQICFPVYAASRLITREYQPHLDELGITYPQYIALMVLWEKDEISVNEITQKLILNTNTVTPLLKRMELQGLITRQRSNTDERKVIVKLTQKGKALEEKAAEIPQKLIEGLADSNMTVNELISLKESLYQIINFLHNK